MVLRDLIKSNFLSNFEFEISKASSVKYLRSVNFLDTEYSTKLYTGKKVDKHVHLFTFVYYYSGLRRLINTVTEPPKNYLFYKYMNFAFIMHSDMNQIRHMEGVQLAASGLLPIHRVKVINKQGLELFVLLYDINFNFDTRINLN